ncbi:head-tail adaptor protein [Pseudomonas akapageensis]|uniref:head-tail adaptor protein n=1 Tax=Pseudomonas akapageensis TaxID=2609961 RepID=UPI001C49B850|nr:head-tail adaptor protein [Pseudomonas akapageensis]
MATVGNVARMREPGAGELNRRIKLRLRSDLPAADFGLDSVFTEEKWRWAKIEPVGTAIYVAGLQIDAKVTHRVILHFLDGLSESHEVLHGVKIYRVRRVADMNGSRRFSVLEVEELGPEQSAGGLYG